MKRDSCTHEASIVGDEGGDLLSVLDELDSDALSDGGVGLLSLDSDLLEHDTLGVGRSSSGRGLVDVSKSSLLVGLVGLWRVEREGQPRVSSRLCPRSFGELACVRDVPIGPPFGRFEASWRRAVLEACWLITRATAGAREMGPWAEGRKVGEVGREGGRGHG